MPSPLDKLRDALGPRLPVHLAKRRSPTTDAGLEPGRALRFPPGFLFGAASASHQVEGFDEHSDWWRFEREPGRVQHFAEFGEEATKRKSDHLARFDEDVALMKQLGLAAYRFGVDWSRCEPRDGVFDEAAIARYGRMCATLRKNGIEPILTFFHWSSPDDVWVRGREEHSGWYVPETAARFGRFVAHVMPSLAEHVRVYVTLNEPNVFVFGGFAEGLLCPGHRRPDADLFRVLRTQFLAHVEARRAIRAVRPDALVGLANNCTLFEPYDDSHVLERVVAAFFEEGFTWSFLDAPLTGTIVHRTRSGSIARETIPGLEGSVDFVGVNYYERNFVRLPHGVDLRRPELVADHHGERENWPRESYPLGFLETLRTVHRRYGLPIYVTENGRAHVDDRERTRFLRDHLAVVGRALAEGIRVEGFLYWSLLDNQEWANGFLPRFGLYEVDYRTFERKRRGTADEYARIIARREIVP